MKYLAVACDYDGTLAENGIVDQPTLDALERVKASGRRLILVTGRELPDLKRVFPYLEMFDRIVAENGALLYRPSSGDEKLLGERPPRRFIERLTQYGVSPLSAGQIIVATWEPNEKAVFEAIHDLGLELQVIFNKGAVMVLPSGVNKASGLTEASLEIGLSPHNTVAIGDAENDHAFLSLCECAVAVDNALPSLRERADFVTTAARGAGVTELIEELVATDLAGREESLKRPRILLGTSPEAGELSVKPFAETLLIAGPSGSGKSTLATGVLERLARQKYQFCIVDPEGDYEEIEGVIVIGDSRREPSVEAVMTVLEDPRQNVAVNLLNVGLEHRPDFFRQLLDGLRRVHSRTGRPHWLIVDEVHQLVPASWNAGRVDLTEYAQSAMLITVHPEHSSHLLWSSVGTVVAVGKHPEKTFGGFAQTIGENPPDTKGPLEHGEAWLWRRGEKAAIRFQIAQAETERRRHRRKYAQGTLGPDKSFYFRGPGEKLNLVANNLTMFIQLADGIDDETWLHHLQKHEYSRWFREAIKDSELANEAARIEGLANASAKETRALIRAEIEKRYTAPA